MNKTKSINDIFESDYEDNLKYGDSKHGNINRNGYFYHVTQQCWNHRNYYSFESARYRDTLLKACCKTHNVSLIMNVIMPNHTHEVLYSPDFSHIQTVYMTIGSKVSKFIEAERKTVFGKDTPKVFQNRPIYTLIENRSQLFYLIYYLYHNPDYLRESGKQAPYSCFSNWEQGNLKTYNVNVFNKLFDYSIQDIMKMCSKMDKEAFRKLNSTCFDKYIATDRRLFIKSKES